MRVAATVLFAMASFVVAPAAAGGAPCGGLLRTRGHWSVAVTKEASTCPWPFDAALVTISCVENRMYLSSEKGHFALNGEAKRWRLMPTARVDDIVLDDPTRPGKKMSVMEWIDAMKFLCGPRF